MREKIDLAFVQALNLDAAVDRATLAYNASPGWDSVGHMALVAALEEQFDCMLDMNDILEMSTYSKVCEIMQKYARAT